MSCDFIGQALPAIQSLQPYQPGKPIEELVREQGLDETSIVKLASNENPLGPSPVVTAAVNNAMASVSRYPDANGFALKQALAGRLNVPMAQITLGNGSNDVLVAVGRMLPECGLFSGLFRVCLFYLFTGGAGDRSRRYCGVSH